MKAGSQHICRLLKGKWGGFRVCPLGRFRYGPAWCVEPAGHLTINKPFPSDDFRVCRCRARTRSCSGLFFCVTGRLHDGRCRLDLRASAALVFPEVLDEQSGELLRGRIVGRLLGPRVARLEDCRWHSRTLRDDVETKCGIAPRLHAGEHAAEKCRRRWPRVCASLMRFPTPAFSGAENHRLIPTPKLMLATRRAAGFDFDSGIGNQRAILGDTSVLLVADSVLVERAGRYRQR